MFRPAPFYDEHFQLGFAEPENERDATSGYGLYADYGRRFGDKDLYGTKDYFSLSGPLTESLSKGCRPPVEIIDLINFSNYWWLRWLTKPLSIPILYALNFFNGLTHNYGVAIIVFTFLFYLLLFPLRWSQSRSFKKGLG